MAEEPRRAGLSALWAALTSGEPTGAGLYPEQLDRIIRSGSTYLSMPSANRDTWGFGPPRGGTAADAWSSTREQEMDANRSAGELSKYVNPATGQPIRQRRLGMGDVYRQLEELENTVADLRARLYNR